MKIAVIGGGSTYTPELVNGFLDRINSLPLTELWLMDIDAERLNIVGGFAQRMVEAKGNPFKVVLTTDQRAAVKGATYVTTQIRVGHMPARVADEIGRPEAGRRGHHLHRDDQRPGLGLPPDGVHGELKRLRLRPAGPGARRTARRR